MLILQGPSTQDVDRSEAFHEFARRRAKGEVLVPPLLLPKYERRFYIRRTLREDHQFRIQNHPEGADAKFDKLAEDAFQFFRGTALLYYRDYAGTDAHLPTVFTIGDIHPENFGVMPNEDGAPFFGVNDFDEACFAPFSFDVKRGALGFWIATELNGFKKKKRRKVVRAWVRGYVDGLIEFVQDDREKWHQWRLDNSPDMIRDLLESAMETRKAFLKDKINLDKEEFIPSDEILPHSKHIADFQALVDNYVKENDIETKTRHDDFFNVKDVAVKKGSGTASLGLNRYWVLIEGPEGGADRDIILELKQARTSALRGLIPDDPDTDTDEAEQIVKAQRVHLAGGDPFYGRAEIDGTPFLVRERSPFKDDIDLEDLDVSEMKTYARICGKTLAQTHARSDEDTGIMEGDAEKRILSSISPDIFVDDITRFAKTAAKRLYRDYKLFKEDHKLGAFTFVHSG
ncbi:MAG TPA: DUF2252 family protein [Rhodothermales bacterium]|nr:DUF2252 family protein [Rhodothermales bacterium]